MRDELLKIWPRKWSIKSLLDLGCRDCWHTASLPGVRRHVGVDVWPLALERARLKAATGGIPYFEPVEKDVTEYLDDTRDGMFDAVIAIDLIEHLPRIDALYLLPQMERVAAKFVVAWTTLGYIKNGPFDVDGQPNPYEEHVWGPTPKVFMDLGWHTNSLLAWHGDRGGALLAWKEL